MEQENIDNANGTNRTEQKIRNATSDAPSIVKDDTKGKVAQNEVPCHTCAYIRVSSKSQKLEMQLHSISEFTKRRGIEFDLFQEVESSRNSRPIKQHLLKLIREGVYDTLIVYSLSRWARSFNELVFGMEELLNKNVNFISVSENLDFTTPSGKMQFRMWAVIADFERDLIKSRLEDSRAERKANGKTFGRPKGSTDKKPRKKSGYYLRYQTKKVGVGKRMGKVENIKENDIGIGENGF